MFQGLRPESCIWKIYSRSFGRERPMNKWSLIALRAISCSAAASQRLSRSVSSRKASFPLPSLRLSPFVHLSWSSVRPISNSQLRALLHFHLCPIYLVVFKGSHGYLILRGASRLDAFSVYPFRTWLPGYAIDMTTGAPAVRPSRSSRTKDSSSQISYARAR